MIRRRLAVGGIVGPLTFITCWAVTGWQADGCAPVDDAISRLAAAGAPTRWWMTAGFVVFGVGVALFGVALREVLPDSRAWIAAVVVGVATLGAAATPLDVSVSVDVLHGVFATAGYASLALLPILVGRATGSRASILVGVLVAALLLATPFVDANGLLQRAGLTLGDLWIVVTAHAILTHRQLTPAPTPTPTLTHTPFW